MGRLLSGPTASLGLGGKGAPSDLIMVCAFSFLQSSLTMPAALARRHFGGLPGQEACDSVLVLVCKLQQPAKHLLKRHLQAKHVLVSLFCQAFFAPAQRPAHRSLMFAYTVPFYSWQELQGHSGETDNQLTNTGIRASCVYCKQGATGLASYQEARRQAAVASKRQAEAGECVHVRVRVCAHVTYHV